MRDGGFEANPSGDYNKWPEGLIDYIQPGTFQWKRVDTRSPFWTRFLAFFGVYRSCE